MKKIPLFLFIFSVFIFGCKENKQTGTGTLSVRLTDAPAEYQEIWIDVQGEKITVRINRELLWQGNYDLPNRKLGLFAENFGETAVYTFPVLEIFAP